MIRAARLINAGLLPAEQADLDEFEGNAMSEKEGTLRMMPSGQWAVCRPGETPHEITSGDLFHIEFAGKLHLTRMKFRYSPRRGYYTVDGYPLRDRLRAAIGAEV